MPRDVWEAYAMDSDRFIFMVDNDEEEVNGAVEDGMSASAFIILLLVLLWTLV